MTTIHIAASREYDVVIEPGLLTRLGTMAAELGLGRRAAVNLTERDACERVCDFNAVENCMTEKEAKQEAGRCLRCDHFGYGIFKGGRSTLW